MRHATGQLQILARAGFSEPDLPRHLRGAAMTGFDRLLPCLGRSCVRSIVDSRRVDWKGGVPE